MAKIGKKIQGLIGSFSGDANAFTSALGFGGGSNKFDQRLKDGLSDLLGGALGIRMSQVPEISAAVLETMVFSSVAAIQIIHSKLPQNHDSFWDKIVSKTNWAEAFVTGACTGIAYHLLIDGTLDGGGHLSGLRSTFDFSMSQESHQTFFVTNSIAEALDLKNKKINPGV